MSFGSLQDNRSSVTIAGYRVLFCFAWAVLGLACLATLEALVTWGEWDGWALVTRLIYLASPIFVFACIVGAKLKRDANHLGAAIGFLSIAMLPALAFVAFAFFVVWRNS